MGSLREVGLVLSRGMMIWWIICRVSIRWHVSVSLIGRWVTEGSSNIVDDDVADPQVKCQLSRRVIESRAVRERKGGILLREVNAHQSAGHCSPEKTHNHYYIPWPLPR